MHPPSSCAQSLADRTRSRRRDSKMGLNHRATILGPQRRHPEYPNKGNRHRTIFSLAVPRVGSKGSVSLSLLQPPACVVLTNHD